MAALLRHGCAPAGLSGGRRRDCAWRQGPGCIPVVTQCCGDPVSLCPTPRLRGHLVPWGAGLCLHGGPWPEPRWLQWGWMPPPVGATRPQGHLAGQRGHHCNAEGKPGMIPVRKGGVTASESQDTPWRPSPRDPQLPLLFCPLFPGSAGVSSGAQWDGAQMPPGMPPSPLPSLGTPAGPGAHGPRHRDPVPRSQGEPRTPVSSSVLPGLGKSLHCARCKRLKGLWFPFRTRLERSH